jgi:hypothetical protein
MRHGRSAVVASLLILAAACCSAQNANAQIAEPGFTNGGSVRQATEEGRSMPDSWAQVLRSDYQAQLGLLAARWFMPVRVQPVIGRKGAVPTRLAAVWRKRS